MATLKDLLHINHPIIMAPMFLVSNTDMVISAMQSGIAGCIPALNYRTIPELETAISLLKNEKVKGGSYGFNLIVNQSNLLYKKQLEALCKAGCDFIITSLGNPKHTIERAHQHGIKVFCDVTDLKFAQKAESLGADALIAVNNRAGGHRGSLSPSELIKTLKEHCSIPIISAGGISNKSDLETILSYGASGVSIGSPFIASIESHVSHAYKQACVDYGKDDIVVTRKLSGTPCTVINTPYVKQIGTQLSSVEHYLTKLTFLKKWIKLLRFIRGTKTISKAAKKATYKTVWVAGPSIEDTKSIDSVKTIINRFI